MTGFEIFGAIGTCVALLNLARQGYESLAKTYNEYRKAGPHIARTQRQCSAIYFNVEAWTKNCGLDIPMTDELYQAHWGQESWKLIEENLAAVHTSCADLAAIIDKALPAIDSYDKIPEKDRERAQTCLARRPPPTRNRLRKRIHQAVKSRTPRPFTEQKVTEMRLLEDHISRTTSARKKIKYVLSSSDQVQKHIKQLNEDFNELKKLVKSAWSLQHPSLDYTTSTLSERYLAALTQARQHLVEEARKDRLHTKALYSCCFGTRQALKLELSLIGTPGDSRSKQFHLFMPQGQYQEHLEVSTVILRRDETLGNLVGGDDILEACGRALQEEPSLLRIPSDVQNSSSRSLYTKDHFWFSLKKCAVHTGGPSLSSLKLQMVSLVTAERLEVAYHVVETGLILLGTPWMSALSTTSLKRLKVSQQPPRYLIDVKERSNLVQTRLSNQRKHLHMYILTIGVTLVEIALLTMIRDLRPSILGIELLIKDSEGLGWRSPRHITSLVNAELGASFSEAVEFCLQDPELASNRLWNKGIFYDRTCTEEQVSLGLLDEFYKNVVVKLEP